MNDLAASLNYLLSDVILPNLKAVQTNQAEQIAAQDRIEEELSDLQVQIRSEFAHLQAQLTACRAEVAALHAMLKASQGQSSIVTPALSTSVN
jgi:polyhydroxyalkanoate synthesis regulator phasin